MQPNIYPLLPSALLTILRRRHHHPQSTTLDDASPMETLSAKHSLSHSSVVVFIFPIGGIIVYFLFSNRQGHKKGYESIA